MKSIESLVTHLENATPQDVKMVVDQVTDFRDRQLKKTGASKSNATRTLGQVPVSIYRKVERLEKGFWDDKVKVREFFRLFPQYRVAEKI